MSEDTVQHLINHGPAADEPPTETIGGGKHTFTISVNVRGAGFKWSSDLAPQAVEAYNLTIALRLASDLPLENWFPSEAVADAPA